MTELAEALRAARAYDLEQPRFAGAPVFPAHEPGLLVHLHRRHEPDAPEPRTSASALLVMTEHSGTHIDALCHQAYDGRLYGDVPVSARVQTSTGFTELGIDTVAPLIARGVRTSWAPPTRSSAPCPATRSSSCARASTSSSRSIWRSWRPAACGSSPSSACR
jgi:Putative cyclase